MVDRIECVVVGAGAGVAGLAVVHALAKRELKTVVLEADQVIASAASPHAAVCSYSRSGPS
jgi:2-polyprenyl-6-methoxyphenol hydroxylase-like FAD-dependent oxidoreductase